MSNPTELPDLLPCPFCASTKIFTEPDEYGSGGQWVMPIHVGCSNCGAGQQCEDIDDVPTVWNRRATPPSPSTAPEVDELPVPPTLPRYLLDMIGEYGMARTDSVGQLEVQNRCEILIGGIKRYASEYGRTLASRPAEVDDWIRVEDRLPEVGTLVMVYSPPTKHDWPDTLRIDFDYLDPDADEPHWFQHGEGYEHFCCVAKPDGSIGPSEEAPYTHWRPVPAAPSHTTNKEK